MSFLPENISLSTSGELSGVPPKVGLFPIKVSTKNMQTGVEMAAGPSKKTVGFWGGFDGWDVGG